MKSAIPFLLAKFTSFNLVAIVFAVNLLNSCVVIYLSRLGILPSISLILKFKCYVQLNH